MLAVMYAFLEELMATNAVTGAREQKGQHTEQTLTLKLRLQFCARVLNNTQPCWHPSEHSLPSVWDHLGLVVSLQRMEATTSAVLAAHTKPCPLQGQAPSVLSPGCLPCRTVWERWGRFRHCLQLLWWSKGFSWVLSWPTGSLSCSKKGQYCNTSLLSSKRAVSTCVSGAAGTKGLFLDPWCHRVMCCH